MKKTPSSGQKEYYAKRREQTLTLIRSVVKDLRQTGTPVTRKNLQKYTGLSDATFSLPHVKELLKELKVLQFSERKVIEEPDPVKVEIEAISSENGRLLKKKDTLERTIELQKKQIDELKQVNSQLNHEVMLLRGKFLQAMELLELKGNDLRNLFKE